MLGPICEVCFKGIALVPHLPGTKILSIGSYEDETLRKLIHAFKYEGMMSAAKPIEQLIKKHLKQGPSLLNSNIENSVIIPVPLHARKEKNRGFNQAAIIADLLGKFLEIEVRRDILKRIRNTDPQIKLATSKDRAANMKGAFALTENAKEEIEDKNIILVDDVYTSGATMKAAIKTLRQAGAKKILIFVMART